MSADDAPLLDEARFQEMLRRLDRHPEPAARDLLDGSRDTIVARAPGRLDVMGGIADYSGSRVLELPLGEATFVAVQAAPDRIVRAVSPGGRGRAPEVRLALDDVVPADGTIDLARLAQRFAADPARHWGAYAIGVLPVLCAARGIRPRHGIRMLVASDVPEGSGVASSAALEVAALAALATLLEVRLDPLELALLAQQAENQVAGAPCGVMDQVTAACGEADHLVQLLCQPAVLEDPIQVPAEVRFFGIDSGVRHAVTGADYSAVRVGAFMGYRILADRLGLPVEPLGAGQVRIQDQRFGGYLANIDPATFEGEFAALLPATIGGAEFLARYGGTTDPVTRIDPARTYAVRAAAAHPVHEHARVRAFCDRLREPLTEATLHELGDLMDASHASYSACGLGSDATDLLAELAHEAGRGQGVFGARVTGGGSGGTVAFLARADAGGVLESIASAYATRTGRWPRLFTTSSPGTIAWGTTRRQPLRAN